MSLPATRGKLVDTHRIKGNFVPQPGDFAVCLYCGELNEYSADLRLIPARAERLAEIDLAALQAMQKFIRQFHKFKEEK